MQFSLLSYGFQCIVIDDYNKTESLEDKLEEHYSFKDYGLPA